MVTMLDCIQRVPSLLDKIIENANVTFDNVFTVYDPNEINEICLIGSGTSYNSAATARYLAESASGVRVTPMLPNEFLYSYTVRNPKALYVLISQTGTSTVTMKAVQYVNEQGFMSACVSEKADTPIAKEAKAFINMGCGYEEYSMRTIGYSTSVLTLMLLGMELGKRNGNLSQADYDKYIAQAKAASANIPSVIEKAQKWMDTSRRKIMKSAFIAFTGTGALYGVASEAAVKVWEAPQYPSAGYELDEGMHGPNYGYNYNHAVIILNDGGRDSKKALQLAKYMKNENQNGYVIGVDTIDEKDLAFNPQGGAFDCLEFAAAIQVLMYRLAVDGGRDFSITNVHEKMNSYFHSHSK